MLSQGKVAQIFETADQRWQLGQESFQVLNDALARTVLYDNVVLASLGDVQRPDMAAERHGKRKRRIIRDPGVAVKNRR